MSEEIEAYLVGCTCDQQAILRRLREQLLTALPDASGAMKYGMPVVLIDGRPVAGYAGFEGHCSYFPMSGSVLAHAGDLVASYEVSKGGLKLPTGGRQARCTAPGSSLDKMAP